MGRRFVDRAPRTVGILAIFAAGLALSFPPRATANADLAKAAEEPGQWVMYGRDYGNTHYSPLAAIHTGNVAQLKAIYAFPLGTLRSNESTPLVVGDTLYVSSSWGPKFVYALEAATGAMKWRYEPEIPEDVMQYACCDVGNRGVAYADGKIFVGRLDGVLVALDAATGKELWKQTVVDYKSGAVITSPPLVVDDLVVSGFGGGEYGVRGYLSAYKIASGEPVWKTYTVPGPGEPGNDTWKGDSWKYGGAAPWLVGSYDPQRNILYWGTSNPSPWNAAVRGPNKPDFGKFSNLYSSSTLALDPKSGKILWHLQGTPHDAWDYDGVNEAVLVDLEIGGKKTPVLLKADRNGFFYVANRETGKIVSAAPFVHVTWAKGFDAEKGHPIEDPEKRPALGKMAKDICPNLIGGKNWQPMSFHPQTKLVYIPANNICMDMKDTEVNYRRGFFYLGKEFPTHPGPGGFMGELLAWDPVQQKKAWSVKEELPFPGGTLSTGGGLVFYGSFSGWFKAVDARSGEVLWKFNVGSGVGAAPITFEVGGKQYVAVVVGRSVSIPGFLGDVGKQMVDRTPEGGTLFVFGL
jgi:alcohol dehydrogenase (cytochrome c)/methanol dehydrogenase (cytochrome c) subunit 1